MKNKKKHEALSVQSAIGVMNVIPRDIRNLFPDINKLPSPEDQLSTIHRELYLDRMEEVYRLNLVSTDDALDDVKYVLKVDDPDLKTIAWSSLGGIQAFNGNYREAFGAFHRALEQKSTNDDVKSFAFTELSNLFRKLEHFREAEAVLTAALKWTTNEQLKWRIRTYIGLCYKYTDSRSALNSLAASEDYYRRNQDYVRLTLVLKHMGNVLVSVRDFEAAEEKYTEAMSMAIEQSLQEYENNIQNDKGWMLIEMGQYKKARDLFSIQVEKELRPYIMALALQNLGFLEFECRNYREAITRHSQSLSLTTRYHLRNMAFEDYYKLGLCHEELGRVGLARHFYSVGFNELIQEIELGLPILGYRRKLLEAYVQFLETYQRIPQVSVKQEIFSFSIGKKLKDIRDIFHKSLFILQLGRTKNAPELCKKMEINTRTYFKYQKKLGLKRGKPQKIPFEDNIHYKQYIESLASLTWREANEKFESDLYSFLIEVYQNNKKKLAEVLDVSYQQVVIKTR